MNLKFEALLDSIGKKILKELAGNARISFSELGRKVGLSSPAVTERVRKMEEAGIIKGYHALINDTGQGETITAFIGMTTAPEQYRRFKALVKTTPGIEECHHVSGEESFMLKVRVPSVKDLETLLAWFSPFGQTRTSLVLSSVPLGSRPGI